MQPEYPHWICSDCGNKLGRKKPGEAATWHISECGICKKQTAVTEPRDFGHLKAEWIAHIGASKNQQTSE